MQPDSSQAQINTHQLLQLCPDLLLTTQTDNRQRVSIISISAGASIRASNCGQFMLIPGPWVFLHHRRSSVSLAAWIVWPRSLYRPTNLWSNGNPSIVGWIRGRGSESKVNPASGKLKPMILAQCLDPFRLYQLQLPWQRSLSRQNERSTSNGQHRFSINYCVHMHST